MLCRNPYCENEVKGSGSGKGFCVSCYKMAQRNGVNSDIPVYLQDRDFEYMDLVQGVIKEWSEQEFMWRYRVQAQKFKQWCAKYNFDYAASLKEKKIVCIKENL